MKANKIGGIELQSTGMQPFKSLFKASFVADPELVINDRRTDEQKQTHTRAVVAYDDGMSGWGGARGGKSYCAWALAPEVDAERVKTWVKARSDMEQVEIVDDLNSYTPKDWASHLSIYVCNQGHPATL